MTGRACTEKNGQSTRKAIEPSVISDVRIDILSTLQKISHRVISGEINADGEVNFSVCRAVFALGENWSDGELERVERELEDLSTNNSM